MTDQPITPEALDAQAWPKIIRNQHHPEDAWPEYNTPIDRGMQAPLDLQVRFDDNPDYGRKYMVYLVTRGIFSHSIALWNITTMQQLKDLYQLLRGTRDTK